MRASFTGPGNDENSSDSPFRQWSRIERHVECSEMAKGRREAQGGRRPSPAVLDRQGNGRASLATVKLELSLGTDAADRARAGKEGESGEV